MSTFESEISFYCVGRSIIFIMSRGKHFLVRSYRITEVKNGRTWESSIIRLPKLIIPKLSWDLILIVVSCKPHCFPLLLPLNVHICLINDAYSSHCRFVTFRLFFLFYRLCFLILRYLVRHLIWVWGISFYNFLFSDLTTLKCSSLLKLDKCLFLLKKFGHSGSNILLYFKLLLLSLPIFNILLPFHMRFNIYLILVPKSLILWVIIETSFLSSLLNSKTHWKWLFGCWRLDGIYTKPIVLLRTHFHISLCPLLQEDHWRHMRINRSSLIHHWACGFWLLLIIHTKAKWLSLDFRFLALIEYFLKVSVFLDFVILYSLSNISAQVCKSLVVNLLCSILLLPLVILLAKGKTCWALPTIEIHRAATKVHDWALPSINVSLLGRHASSWGLRFV